MHTDSVRSSDSRETLSNPAFDGYGLADASAATVTTANTVDKSINPGRAAHRQLHPAFRRHRFLLKQRMMTISHKYDVADEAGGSLMFVHRPAHMGRMLLGALVTLVFMFGFAAGGIALAVSLEKTNETLAAICGVGGVAIGIIGGIALAVIMSPKRHITFYTDQSKVGRLLEVLQVNKLHLLVGTYAVMDAEGEPLAMLKKFYLTDIIRKRWKCTDAEGNHLCTILEDSWARSILRRLLGQFSPLLAIAFRTNFIIIEPVTNKKLGMFNRKATILDRYVLDMTTDPDHVIDRRIAVAIGVLLDTAERR